MTCCAAAPRPGAPLCFAGTGFAGQDLRGDREADGARLGGTESFAGAERRVRSDGVLIMDEPQRGSVANFAGTKAIYAGTGWW